MRGHLQFDMLEDLEQLDDEPVPGVCMACGCTEDDACDGGCIWANADATLCSQCAGDP